MAASETTFLSGGERCAATVHEPSGRAPHPCVVAAHGFGGVREARLGAFAERFVAAGLGVVVFDYRCFGASEGTPRQLLDAGAQLQDWRAAVGYARSLGWVDPSRVALWGTSFGGGHVAAIAAADDHICAAVSQAPMLDGLSALRAVPRSGLLRLAAAGLRDEAHRLLGRPPHLIPIVGPPGTTAAMTSPDAEPGYRALFEPGDVFRNEVAARIALRIAAYRPGRLASRVSCPWLVCVCERDAVTPPGPSIRAAARAPRGELRSYDAGHFDIYRGPVFEAAVADQIEFLRRQLVPAG